MYKTLFICFSLFLITYFPSFSFSKESNLMHISEKKSSYNLILYMNPKCGYCKKVTDYLNQSKRSVAMKNTQDLEVRAELTRIGGKPQIPCLVINGKALYESDAIIEWLKTHP